MAACSCGTRLAAGADGSTGTAKPRGQVEPGAGRDGRHGGGTALARGDRAVPGKGQVGRWLRRVARGSAAARDRVAAPVASGARRREGPGVARDAVEAARLQAGKSRQGGRLGRHDELDASGRVADGRETERLGHGRRTAAPGRRRGEGTSFLALDRAGTRESWARRWRGRGPSHGGSPAAWRAGRRRGRKRGGGAGCPRGGNRAPGPGGGRRLDLVPRASQHRGARIGRGLWRGVWGRRLFSCRRRGRRPD
jgi:hypothetical protein